MHRPQRPHHAGQLIVEGQTGGLDLLLCIDNDISTSCHQDTDRRRIVRIAHNTRLQMKGIGREHPLTANLPRPPVHGRQFQTAVDMRHSAQIDDALDGVQHSLFRQTTHRDHHFRPETV